MIDDHLALHLCCWRKSVLFLSMAVFSNLGTWSIVAVTIGVVAMAFADDAFVPRVCDAFDITGATWLGFADRAPSTGLFVTVVLCFSSCLMTVLQVIEHLANYTQPMQQRYVIRILLMVPIYAVDSFVGFAMTDWADSMALIRDTYEAYVLYNFYHLLLSLTGGEEGTVAAWKKVYGETGGTMKHLFPTNLVWGPFPLDLNTLHNWRFLLVQYMVLSPLITLATFALSFEGWYNAETWSVENAHLYLTLIKSVSVTLAFTALFYFYLACKHTHELHPHHPTGKFMAVKFVVFLGFWQSVVIAGLGSYNLVPHSLRPFLLTWHRHRASEAVVEEALENLLTVGEMFITAVLHHLVFSFEEFQTGGDGHSNSKALEKKSFFAAVVHAFSVGDVAADAKSTLKTAAKKAQEAKKDNEQQQRKKKN